MPGSSLPLRVRIYVTLVIAGGAVLLARALPFTVDRLELYVAIFALSSLASGFKIHLPLRRSWATMAASESFHLMSVLLFGVGPTLPMVIVGAWIQSTYHSKSPSPLYRKLFNAAELVITIQIVGWAVAFAGGNPEQLGTQALVKPLLAGATVYFLANSLLVAGAVALSTNQSIFRCWHDNFLWSAPGYYLSAGIAGLAVRVVESEAYVLALLVAVPLYLGYRSYRIYLGRIEEEQQRLMVTLRSIGEAVITTDLRGAIVLINNVAETLTGWSQEEAAGRPILDVLKIVDRGTREQVVDPVAIVSEHGRFDVPNPIGVAIDRTDEIQPVEVTGALIKDHDQRRLGVVLVIRDVTEALLAEQERLKASKLESLGMLAGGIAHDFNNILTAVVGHLTLLKSDLRITPEMAEQLDEAEQACMRARTLTQQLLTFSKGGDPVRRPVRIARLVEDSTTFALRGSTVRAIFDIAPDAWPVEADEGQLDRVVSNVVLNAGQAMPQGGTLRVALANVKKGDAPGAAAVRGNDYVAITITDEGIGIPENNLAKIFDPYFTTKPTGSGLGLAAAHSIVKGHDGFITVDSEVGKGTEFKIYLPRTKRAVIESRAVHRPMPPAGSGRVLVMDDERMIRDVTAAMLRRLGYECETVSDGRQAIERVEAALIEDRPFHAALIDLTVPGGMGGREAIAHLHRIDPDLKALVFSGYADGGVLADYAHYGFAAALAKPFTIQDLADALRDILGTETVGTGHR